MVIFLFVFMLRVLTSKLLNLFVNSHLSFVCEQCSQTLPSLLQYLYSASKTSHPCFTSFSPLSGLPKWCSSKEPTCQCKRCWFDPWVRKISWRRKWQPTWRIPWTGEPDELQSGKVHRVAKESDATEYTRAPLSILCWLLFSASRRLAGEISVPPPVIEP